MMFGYVRVSTLEQAGVDRTSLREQERVIRGYAMMQGVDRENLVVFRDPGVSGATPLENRPAGVDLLAGLKKGDVVVAAKLDRMFRSALDALATVKLMRKLGVSLVLLDLGTGPVTQDGMAECFFTMAAAFAQLDRTRIAERMADGKRAKKARGGHIGGSTPYGKVKIGEGREARLVDNPDEQEVLRKVKALFAYHKSAYRVAQELTRHGIVSRNDTPFHYKQIERMVQVPKMKVVW